MERIFKIVLPVSMLMLVGSFSTVAQGKSTNITKQPSFDKLSSSPKQSLREIKPLAIGEAMPDISFTMVNFPKKSVKISDFRGKLLVLDFWATWCGSCVESFPKLISLQKKFGNQLQILLVDSKGTGDTKEKIIQFIKKREGLQKTSFSLPTAVDDELAAELFPHVEVPHCIWITPDGVIKAITATESLTTENIQKVLSEQMVQMDTKRDFFPNKISQFDEDLTIDNSLTHYSFFKKGKLEGWTTISQARSGQESPSVLRGILMRNVSLLDMYLTAIDLKPEYTLLRRNKKRVILEVSDSSRLFFTKNGENEKKAWEKENLYSYDLVIPADQSNDIYNYIAEDLNRFSGFVGGVEKRKINCWAIVDGGVKASLKTSMTSNTDGDKHFLTADMPFLARAINLNMGAIKEPVIDMMGKLSSTLVDIVLDLNDTSEGLKKKLNAIGLDLVMTSQELDMLVIREKYAGKKTN